MILRSKAIVALGVVAILAAACGSSTPAASGGGGGGGADVKGALVARSAINIEVVTHGQAVDGFWGVVRNGFKQAALDYGIKYNYSAPDTESDYVKMSQLIDAAVAKKPQGIIVSIPNAEALGPSIEKAVAAGIPVISINSGSDVFKELGVILHVGQTEYEAGLGAGTMFKDAGVKNPVCFNQEVANQALTLRCNGFFAGLGISEADAKDKVLTGQISDPAGITATIKAALQADPTIDGILTLGPSAATPMMAAVEEAGLTGKIKIATFDLSTDVLNAIKDGKMEFAVDQQQYIQGYDALAFMIQYIQTKNLPTGNGMGLMMTGPGFVTKDNAAAVISLAAAGLR
jgi:simple sugar transport system substrate-binding protein